MKVKVIGLFARRAEDGLALAVSVGRWRPGSRFGARVEEEAVRKLVT